VLLAFFLGGVRSVYGQRGFPVGLGKIDPFLRSIPAVDLDSGRDCSRASPTTDPVQTSLRLGVLRDAPESDPVFIRRPMNVLLPLRVTKLTGPCNSGRYCSLARRRTEDSRRSASAEPNAVTTLSEFLHLPCVFGRTTYNKARNCEAKNEQRSHRACPG
jgi:hypothetical protein